MRTIEFYSVSKKIRISLNILLLKRCLRYFNISYCICNNIIIFNHMIPSNILEIEFWKIAGSNGLISAIRQWHFPGISYTFHVITVTWYSNDIIDHSPAWAAKWSGVLPSLSGKFGSTPSKESASSSIAAAPFPAM